MSLSLVTGANRGIGLALCQRLAQRGPTIGTTRGAPPSALPNDTQQGAQGQSQAQSAGDLSWRKLDVTDPASQAALSQALGGQAIQHLVCNAGVYLDKGAPLDTGFPAQMWADSFAVNVTGVFLTVQALLPQLRAATGAKIMVISSQMASHTRAPGGSYIYRASKAAALNLGRNLATDLAAEGIAVGIYHPGWVSTDMGGASAPLDVDTAADGLLARLDALSLDTTGCFETWDGQPHAY